MSRRRSGLNFSRRRKKFNLQLFKEILSWGVEIVIVIIIAYVMVGSFGFRTTVVGQAMESTLLNGENIFVNRFGYLISQPKAGDIIVFLPNGNEKSHYYVRRVIGVPGDVVQIRDGAVYIDGELYNESTTVSSVDDPGMAIDEIKLSEDEFFVLGDNRNNSEDSRYANIGNVKKDYIIGKAWFHFAGLGNMGRIK